MDWDTFWQLVIAVTVLQVITFLGARLLLGLLLADLTRRLAAVETGLASLTTQVADLVARVTALEQDQPTPEPPEVSWPDHRPDNDNVGTGIIKAYPTTIVYAETPGGTIEFDSEPDEPIVNTVFMDRVAIRTDGWRFLNCSFRGPLTWTAGGNLVYVDQDTVTPEGKPVFTYCDFNPQTADSHWNAIGWKLYRLEYCHIWGTVDGLAIYALAADPDPAVHVEVYATWIERLSQFKPDVAGNRDVTHNDGAQLQGNDGPADDALFELTRIDGYASTDQGTPQPPEHTQISAIMLTPNQQDKVCLTVRKAWMSGGVFTLNGTASSNSKSILVLEDVIWERRHQSTGGPSAEIALDATFTNRTLRNNIYADDGSPVPVYNG